MVLVFVTRFFLVLVCVLVGMVMLLVLMRRFLMPVRFFFVLVGTLFEVHILSTCGGLLFLMAMLMAMHMGGGSRLRTQMCKG